MTAESWYGPRWPRVTARATSATLAVLAVGQAAFAGSFLGGQYDALGLHSAGAKVTTVLSVVQVVVLVIVSRTGGPRWPIAVATLVTILFIAEFASGELRLTALHVPLGVLLIVGIFQLTASVWRLPLAARSRSAQRDVIR
ncbi:hypothetical protein A5685_23780 [Mycobacterium colombiense]|uniref:Uncharacterized protein n=1 Tax=Mycobacterium colombiense TaxID=339268 RepID=A0A1A2SEW7_9MYCO|nr:hypothetical protein [Mycobacterium colombiense]OBH62686.1 hypothetical protein A5685_23780 [Mycobacterium colombiense]